MHLTHTLKEYANPTQTQSVWHLSCYEETGLTATLQCRHCLLQHWKVPNNTQHPGIVHFYTELIRYNC